MIGKLYVCFFLVNVDMNTRMCYECARTLFIITVDQVVHMWSAISYLMTYKHLILLCFLFMRMRYKPYCE